MTAVTQLLSSAAQGDPAAAAELLPLVYRQLRALASSQLAMENSGQTLQPTALVHEAYLRLLGADASQSWNNRGHFFCAAAEAMRRILIDAARRKSREKHGGQLHRVPLADLPEGPTLTHDTLLDLNEALDRLAADDPAKAELVKLKYFAGLTLEEAANCQNVSLSTAKRRWESARTWLYLAITSEKNEIP